MNNAVNILREGSMMKALTKLGIPIVIAMLIMAIYNVRPLQNSSYNLSFLNIFCTFMV